MKENLGLQDSFLDMMAGTQDKMVVMATKSLSYSTFHLQKIRCLYGTRATLDFYNIDDDGQLMVA